MFVEVFMQDEKIESYTGNTYSQPFKIWTSMVGLDGTAFEYTAAMQIGQSSCTLPSE